MKQRIVLIAAVIIGIFAAFLTHQYLRAKNREVNEAIGKIKGKYRTVQVVVAARPLPAGSVITMEDIGPFSVVEQQLRHDVVKVENHRDLIGRKTLNRLEKGAPLFWSDIAGGAPGSRGLAEDVKPGCRAMSINVSGAAAVSGMVRPNDHIDVIGTFSFPSREHPGELELVTLTIIQDVTVLATGTETAKSALAGSSRAGSYNMVTLEVTPREAEMLVFAEQIKGRLSLALRNPSDVHYESELPRVNFEKIEEEIESLNTYRQRTLLRKRE
ncbi:MAG: Flp pilus assembly protein CpaB [Kiritimatiellae bacterium]|nr:Flp pilus assembly protein CpaB [Kiritimatiellia bacterium]